MLKSCCAHSDRVLSVRRGKATWQDQGKGPIRLRNHSNGASQTSDWARSHFNTSDVFCTRTLACPYLCQMILNQFKSSSVRVTGPMSLFWLSSHVTGGGAKQSADKEQQVYRAPGNRMCIPRSAGKRAFHMPFWTTDISLLCKCYRVLNIKCSAKTWYFSSPSPHSPPSGPYCRLLYFQLADFLMKFQYFS